MITKTEMEENREKLISWQKEEWYKEKEGLHIHLGCGSAILPGYTNVNIKDERAGVKADFRLLEWVENNSVKSIVSHHALEHIPVRDLIPTLTRWYQVLSPNGTLELGMPDLELCMNYFLNSTEDEKYTWSIWTIYGFQTAEENTNKVYNSIEKPVEYEQSQSHLSGLSLGKAIQILERIGFKMIDAYQYDGYDTPSFFIYAKKPDLESYKQTALEKDVVVGTFTNTTKYLSELWNSVNEQIPHIPFITRLGDKQIVENMNILWDMFKNSGKRYWVFLDHDIQFLNKDIIKNALNTMIRNKAGIVTVYMTGDKYTLIEPYNNSNLEEHLAEWAVGYFMMVDSHKIAPKADINLPCHNTGIDISFSLDVKNAGYDIFVSPDLVYHTKKNTPYNVEKGRLTEEYMNNKWGEMYKNSFVPLKAVLN